MSGAFPAQDRKDSPGSTKRKRVTRACDRCHRGGIKCSASSTPGVCEPCAQYNLDCTYDRPAKRRGPMPRSSSGRGMHMVASESNGSAVHAVPDDKWEYEEVAPTEAIDELVDAYHRIVYPICPYYHWPTFIRDIRNRRYETDRPFFAGVMAVCAIAAARLRDGAARPDSPISPHVSSIIPPSEVFHAAAKAAIPSDLSTATDFGYKRAKVTLAMSSIQYGRIVDVQTHVGDYITMCANDGFHNESRWPMDLKEPDIQERRRLFWAGYCVDVYIATTFGGIVRHREAQSTVLYPAEVLDDDEITEHGIVSPGTSPASTSAPSSRVSWLRGWNFATDMYRILEHALDQLRARRTYGDEDRSAPVTTLFAAPAGPSVSEILKVITNLYDGLPREFKGAQAMTGRLRDDRYGFQAANIIITIQTLKMVLTGLEEDPSVEKRCAIAGELLDALATVPTAYFHASSSPMLHHLAGVGHLLGGVIQSPLSQWSYLQVRNVLLAMADLLSTLESAMSYMPGIADRLRAHVSRIDQYMTTAAMERSRYAQVFHHSLPAAAWTAQTPTPPHQTGTLAAPTAGTTSTRSPSNSAPNSTAGEAGTKEPRSKAGGNRRQPQQPQRKQVQRTGPSATGSGGLGNITPTTPGDMVPTNEGEKGSATANAQRPGPGTLTLTTDPDDNHRSGNVQTSSLMSIPFNANQGRNGRGVETATLGSRIVGAANPGPNLNPPIPGDWELGPWREQNPLDPRRGDDGHDDDNNPIHPLSGTALNAVTPVTTSGVVDDGLLFNGFSGADTTQACAQAQAQASISGVNGFNGDLVIDPALDATQFTLPTDLFADWPYDMGDAFDFLGDWQQTAALLNNASGGGGGGGGTGAGGAATGVAGTGGGGGDLGP